MDFQVILSDFFISDLKEIVDYLAVHSDVEITARIGNELLVRALDVGKKPFIGQPIRQMPGARKVLCYRYLIYYDVNEARRMVEILRVWHGARDPKTLRLTSGY